MVFGLLAVNVMSASKILMTSDTKPDENLIAPAPKTMISRPASELPFFSKEHHMSLDLSRLRHAASRRDKEQEQTQATLTKAHNGPQFNDHFGYP